MAYGLQVNNANGQARLYENSWFMNFHSNQSHVVGPETTKNVSIPGFDPNRWGIALLFIRKESGFTSSAEGFITLNSGYVALSNSGSSDNIQFEFMVLKGN